MIDHEKYGRAVRAHAAVGPEANVSAHKHDDPLADLEALRMALRRPDFSHVSYSRWCGVDLLHAYRRAPESPSGCEHVAGFRDTPASQQVLADESKRAQAPGQMGIAACSGRGEP